MIGALPVLTYHSLDDSGSPISCSASWFRETLRILASEGYWTVDLASWISQGRPDVGRTFGLTFDDGLRSSLASLDVLSSLGFSATFFLVTDCLGRDNAWPGQPPCIPSCPCLDVRDVERIRDAGHALAAHTRTHPRLDRLDSASVEAELCDSQAAIEDWFGVSSTLFAHPYGKSSSLSRSIASRFFAASFGTRPGFVRADDAPHDLPRIDGYDLRAPSRLRAFLSGRFEGAMKARWTARKVRSLAADLRRRRGLVA